MYYLAGRRQISQLALHKPTWADIPQNASATSRFQTAWNVPYSRFISQEKILRTLLLYAKILFVNTVSPVRCG